MCVPTILEIPALHHLLNGERLRELRDLLKIQRFKPFAVIANLHLFKVEDLADLRKIVLEVLFDLHRGDKRPLFELIRGIPDLRSEIANNKDDLMPEVLDVSSPMGDSGISFILIRATN